MHCKGGYQNTKLYFLFIKVCPILPTTKVVGLPDSLVKKHCFMHNVTDHTIVTGHTPTMFIEGEYDNTYPDGPMVLPTTNIYDIAEGQEDPTKRPCPVVKVQYPNESPRYFTDDGCHGAPKHHGNVCVFTNTGELVEVFNSDPTDEQPYDWSTDYLN